MGLLRKAKNLEKRSLAGLESDFPEIRESRMNATIVEPVREYLPRERADTLLNLLDLFQELSVVSDPETFYNSLIQNFLAQAGTRSVAVFILSNRNYSLKAVRTFKLERSMQIPENHPLPSFLRENLRIQSHEALVKKHGRDNKDLTVFEANAPALYVPIIDHHSLVGLLMVGHSVTQDAFSRESLVYMQLFGEVLGAFRTAIANMDLLRDARRNTQSKEELLTGFEKLVDSFSEVEKSAENLSTFLHTYAFQDSVILLLKQDFQYKAALHWGIHPTSLLRLEAKLSSNDQSIHPEQYSGSVEFFDYIFANLKDEEKFFYRFAAVIPFMKKDVCQAVLIKLSPSPIEPVFSDRYAKLAVKLFLAVRESRLLSSSGNSSSLLTMGAHSHFIEIFNILENQARKSGSPYSLIRMDYANRERLTRLLGEEWLASSTKILLKILASDGNYPVAEVLPGRFFVIIDGARAPAVWAYEKKIGRIIAKEFPEEEKRPVYRISGYSRPDDPDIEPEKFLFS